MDKIKTLLIIAVMTSSSFAFSKVLITTYRHAPCDSWSFNGTCNFYSFNKVGADGRSVQRAIDILEQKINNLEAQVETLTEENAVLKEQLIGE